MMARCSSKKTALNSQGYQLRLHYEENTRYEINEPLDRLQEEMLRVVIKNIFSVGWEFG